MSNIENLITSLFGNQVQSLEDAMRTMLFRLDIDRMADSMLDLIGEIVGQDRLGYNDEFYRALIKTKIGANVSQGGIEEVLTVWKKLAGTENVTLTEVFPAKIKLSTDVYLSDDIFNFIKIYANNILAAGIKLETIIVDDPSKFGFGSSRGKFGSDWASTF